MRLWGRWLVVDYRGLLNPVQKSFISVRNAAGCPKYVAPSYMCSNEMSCLRAPLSPGPGVESNQNQSTLHAPDPQAASKTSMDVFASCFGKAGHRTAIKCAIDILNCLRMCLAVIRETITER